jgi:16S rRNA (cytosine1402-N4)-methyltransferase
MSTPVHEPVLLVETLTLLDPARGGLFVDCTVGLGGHSRALLEAGAERVIGLDRDVDALQHAAAALASFGDRVELVHADYRELDRVLDERGIAAVNGTLADLGVSSMQLDSEGRGFSFRRDEPLDMRMDRTQGPTAAALIAAAEERELADVIFQYGEERFSRRIARALVTARSAQPVETTGQLAQIVRRAVPSRGYQRIDPATRTFQALRIWVNRELEGLEQFLSAAPRRLGAGARLAVISFHSLEDRIVKHAFRALQHGEAALRILTKRPIAPGDGEVARNPRARSAKLRAIERTA